MDNTELFLANMWRNEWLVFMGFPQGQKKLCVIKDGVKQQMKYLYTCFLEAAVATHCLDREFAHWTVPQTDDIDTKYFEIMN